MRPASAPFDRFIEAHGVMILDGGLATQLEADGHDLRHALWSAKVVIDAPQAVAAVHRRYLEAGAECVIAATYQATPQGLMAAGVRASDADAVILEAVDVAIRARDLHAATRPELVLRPLVAASVGPYGATLADGSEYRGDDTLSVQQLVDFHRPRWELLQASGADCVVGETIPSNREVAALATLFGELHAKPGWISVSCRDGRCLSDGTPIEEAARLVDDADGVWGMGINCTAPQHVSSLLRRCREAGIRKPFAVYPNSGERFDGTTRTWTGHAAVAGFARRGMEWVGLGARVVGGCCRTGPEHVRSLRRAARTVS